MPQSYNNTISKIPSIYFLCSDYYYKIIHSSCHHSGIKMFFTIEPQHSMNYINCNILVTKRHHNHGISTPLDYYYKVYI